MPLHGRPALEVHVRRCLRLRVVLSATALVAAACGAPSPSPRPGDSRGPPASPQASVPRPRPPAPTGGQARDLDLFSTAYAPVAGHDGGQVVIGAQEAHEFNPFRVDLTSEANVASAIWATLTVLTSDGKYAPDLAAEIPTLANGGVRTPGDPGDAMTVTWKLRDGLLWSDGVDLTCDDFKYAWEWVRDRDNAGVITLGWSDITAWECPSPTVIVQHFGAVYAGYLSLVTAPLPRHVLAEIPIRDQVQGAGFRLGEVADLPVSGAFAFELVAPGAELRLVRNSNYRSWSTRRAAHLDSLVFKWYGDPDAMIADYRGGEVDIAIGLNEGDLPKVVGLGDQVSAIPGLTYELLRPNWSAADDFDRASGLGGCSRNPALADRGFGCPMADPELRRALAHAIDKEELNERLFSGLAEIASGGVTPSAWFYADQEGTPYDPDRARSILDDAGWVLGAGGIRARDGLRANVELCTPNGRQVRRDALALISQQLRAVGIDSVMNPVPSNQIFAGLNESIADTPCALGRGNFDLALHSFGSSIDPLGYYLNYHSSQFEPMGANDARVRDPRIDAALEAVKASVDFQVVREAMDDFQALYVEKTVEIPLFYSKQVELHAPRLGNFFANPTQAGPTWNVVDWYVRG